MEELTVKQAKQEPSYANCGLNERKTTIWSNNITRIVQEKSLVKMEHQKNTQHNTLIFTEHGFSQSWDSTRRHWDLLSWIEVQWKQTKRHQQKYGIQKAKTVI